MKNQWKNRGWLVCRFWGHPKCKAWYIQLMRVMIVILYHRLFKSAQRCFTIHSWVVDGHVMIEGHFWKSWINHQPDLFDIVWWASFHWIFHHWKWHAAVTKSCWNWPDWILRIKHLKSATNTTSVWWFDISPVSYPGMTICDESVSYPGRVIVCHNYKPSAFGSSAITCNMFVLGWKKACRKQTLAMASLAFRTSSWLLSSSLDLSWCFHTYVSMCFLPRQMETPKWIESFIVWCGYFKWNSRGATGPGPDPLLVWTWLSCWCWMFFCGGFLTILQDPPARVWKFRSC